MVGRKNRRLWWCQSHDGRRFLWSPLGGLYCLAASFSVQSDTKFAKNDSKPEHFAISPPSLLADDGRSSGGTTRCRPSARCWRSPGVFSGRCTRLDSYLVRRSHDLHPVSRDTSWKAATSPPLRCSNRRCFVFFHHLHFKGMTQPWCCWRVDISKSGLHQLLGPR